MRIRTGAVLGSAAALAVSAVAVAAPTPYKVTGGGQTFASAFVADGKPTVKGPGDTITFQASIPGTGLQTTGVSGSVNIIDRVQDEETGQSLSGKGIHYKGTVTCAFLETAGDGGGYAELYGTARTKDGGSVPFAVRIADNGQGAAAEADLVEFQINPADPCSDAPQDGDPGFTLARGNAKIHKQNPSTTSKSKASSTTSTATKSTSLLSALR